MGLVRPFFYVFPFSGVFFGSEWGADVVVGYDRFEERMYRSGNVCD